MSCVLAALARAEDDRCALVDAAGSMSYRELRNVVQTVAQQLPSAGHWRAAVLADNGRAWVIADLALLMRAATSVPIPKFFSTAQIEHVLNDAAIECVFTDQAELVREIDPAFEPRRMPQIGLSLLVRRCTGSALPSRTAKVTYTSGSTGMPKGVCLPQSSIESVGKSLQQVTGGLALKRHLSLLPLSTLLENVAGMYVPLLAQSTFCVPSLDATGVTYGGIDAARLISCIDRYGPDSLVLVPELLRALIVQRERGWRPAQPLRFIAVGGARVSPADVEHAHELGLPVYEGYGLSECSSVVCLNTPEAARMGSVGRPLPHAAVRTDARGELHVRGAVMSGYLGSTALADDEIATGDLGEIDDEGFVYVRGRAKNLIITSLGRNISAEWIESALLREPVITQAMVVGEAQPFLSALIVSEATDEQIHAALTNVNVLLPDYARVRAWRRLARPLSRQEGLLTLNGRLRREAIAARYASTITALFAAP
ncbi:MAG: AMP-binding protein, partial [Steroidobacteraceae bacterium]